MTRIRFILGVVILVLVLTVIEAITHPGSNASPVPRKHAPIHSVYHRPLVRRGAPGSPHAVLYGFATAYARVSGPTAKQSYRLMLSLAAPPLLSALQTPSERMELAALSSPGQRGTLQSQLLSVTVTAAVGDSAHGAVMMEQRLFVPGRSPGSALQSSYAADLIRRGGNWRVSQFTLLP